MRRYDNDGPFGYGSIYDVNRWQNLDWHDRAVERSLRRLGGGYGGGCLVLLAALASPLLFLLG